MAILQFLHFVLPYSSLRKTKIVKKLLISLVHRALKNINIKTCCNKNTKIGKYGTKTIENVLFFVSYTKFWPLLFVVVTPIFTIVGDVKCWRIWLLFLLLNRICIDFLYIFIGKINKRLDLLRHSSVCWLILNWEKSQFWH